MNSVSRKTFLRDVDGTPCKRVFLSIISDYNLRTGLCELIDNALDLWTINNKSSSLRIAVTLDAERQMISVKDNAGGVGENELELLIAPGASRENGKEEVIGIFGVGGKRAAVTLGRLVEIRTRRKKEKSLQLDITEEWLTEPQWGISVHEIPDVEPGTTTIDISKLRQSFNAEDVEAMRTHLRETYAWFIREGCKLALNESPIEPIFFEAWAFPPKYKPRRTAFQIAPVDDGVLTVTMSGGLIRDRDAEKENYGVYVYCNHRLIVKELRSRDVGYFISNEAGVPHPDASLCRVILQLQGAPEFMPWNSSKSGINYSHPAFIQIRPTLITLVSFFSRLSRRLKKDWAGQVYRHTVGDFELIDPSEISNQRIVLPNLPRAHKPPRMEVLKSRNKKILEDQPWTLGLIEAMGLVDLVAKQNLETRNRAALILLDSNFEIAMKEFIVSRKDIFKPFIYDDAKIAQLFKSRTNVVNAVKAHVQIPQTDLSKADHYYSLRNKLIHERATVGITDTQIADYRKTVERILKILFGLKFPAT